MDVQARRAGLTPALPLLTVWPTVMQPHALGPKYLICGTGRRAPPMQYRAVVRVGAAARGRQPGAADAGVGGSALGFHGAA